MAKRPALTDESFLKHLFSPKRNPVPTGVRKTALSGLRGGRVKSRLASFNRMSATSQEMLRRAGLRDAYLRREATLSDARRALRASAVDKGLARPTRNTPRRVIYVTELDAAVAQHVARELREANRPVNDNKLYSRIQYMPDDDKQEALHWPVARIRAYGRDDTKMVIIQGERPFNPLWYH